MAGHEIRSFQRALSPWQARIDVFDLLGGLLRPRDLEGVDLMLLGRKRRLLRRKGGAMARRSAGFAAGRTRLGRTRVRVVLGLPGDGRRNGRTGRPRPWPAPRWEHMKSC